jgi:hypothetical protein
MFIIYLDLCYFRIIHFTIQNCDFFSIFQKTIDFLLSELIENRQINRVCTFNRNRF